MTDMSEVDGINKFGVKSNSRIKANSDEGPGIIYVGRIPHGFYEHEMREYFSQFGDISRLRLSRSLKTGQSKHYAFIEFKSAGVAKIVADTMNNYLIFGHLLKCKLVAPEQLHEGIWKGANKRFKAVPWNKMEGRKLEMPVGRHQWNTRVAKEAKRRQSKKEKLKEIGYEFDPPQLKGVDQVPIQDTVEELENKANSGQDQESSAVFKGGEGASPLVDSQLAKTKKTKTNTNGDPKETITTVIKENKRAFESSEEATRSKIKKVKKIKVSAA